MSDNNDWPQKGKGKFRTYAEQFSHMWPICARNGCNEHSHPDYGDLCEDCWNDRATRYNGRSRRVRVTLDSRDEER